MGIPVALILRNTPSCASMGKKHHPTYALRFPRRPESMSVASVLSVVFVNGILVETTPAGGPATKDDVTTSTATSDSIKSSEPGCGELPVGVGSRGRTGKFLYQRIVDRVRSPPPSTRCSIESFHRNKDPNKIPMYVKLADKSPKCLKMFPHRAPPKKPAMTDRFM